MYVSYEKQLKKINKKFQCLFLKGPKTRFHPIYPTL